MHALVRVADVCIFDFRRAQFSDKNLARGPYGKMKVEIV